MSRAWQPRSERGLLLMLLLVTGCGTPPGREAIPYQFRQSLLAADGEGRRAPGARGKRKAPRPAKEQAALPALTRCRAQVGRRFAGPPDQARLQLIQACLGRPVPDIAVQGERLALRQRSPRPGSLVLFHNTRDQNANRQLDDEFTEVGVVVEVRGPAVAFVYLRQLKQCAQAASRAGAASNRAPDGAACAAAAAAEGVLNLHQPHRRRLRGQRVQNTYLRIIRREDPAKTRYLAGQLLAGFAAPPIK